MPESIEKQGIIKNPRMHKNICGLVFGGDEEDRTPDLCIANAALSQLSYTPEFLSKLHQWFASDRVLCPNTVEIASRSVIKVQELFPQIP